MRAQGSAREAAAWMGSETVGQQETEKQKEIGLEWPWKRIRGSRSSTARWGAYRAGTGQVCSEGLPCWPSCRSWGNAKSTPNAVSEHGLPLLLPVQLLAEEPQQQHHAHASLPAMMPGWVLPGAHQLAPPAKPPVLCEPLPAATRHFVAALVGLGWALTCQHADPKQQTCRRSSRLQ